MAKTPQQMSDNWVAAMGNGTTAAKYKAGIAGFSGNPMALAAAPDAMAAYQNGVMNSITSGKRAAALNRADPNVWRQNAQTIGASALTTGATKAKAKVAAHFNRWAPIYAQASAAAKALPKSDWQGRMVAAINIMMAAKGS